MAIGKRDRRALILGGLALGAIGVYFYGTEGTFHMGWRDGWTFYPVSDRKPILHEDPQLRDPGGLPVVCRNTPWWFSD